MGVRRCRVTAFSVFFSPWGFSLIERQKRKKKLDNLNAESFSPSVTDGEHRKMLRILVFFNTSPVIVFTSQKATHRLLSSAALFYSGFYCVILIWPRPVTHTMLSDRSVARLVVQSTLTGGA